MIIGYAAPVNTYKEPATDYAAPVAQTGYSSGSDVVADGYGAPKPDDIIEIPVDNYEETYAAPQAQHQAEYGTPQPTYEAPAVVAPSTSYGSPQAGSVSHSNSINSYQQQGQQQIQYSAPRHRSDYQRAIPFPVAFRVNPSRLVIPAPPSTYSRVPSQDFGLGTFGGYDQTGPPSPILPGPCPSTSDLLSYIPLISMLLEAKGRLVQLISQSGILNFLPFLGAGGLLDPRPRPSPDEPCVTFIRTSSGQRPVIRQSIPVHNVRNPPQFRSNRYRFRNNRFNSFRVSNQDSKYSYDRPIIPDTQTTTSNDDNSNEINDSNVIVLAYSADNDEKSSYETYSGQFYVHETDNLNDLFTVPQNTTDYTLTNPSFSFGPNLDVFSNLTNIYILPLDDSDDSLNLNSPPDQSKNPDISYGLFIEVSNSSNSSQAYVIEVANDQIVSYDLPLNEINQDESSSDSNYDTTYELPLNNENILINFPPLHNNHKSEDDQITLTHGLSPQSIRDSFDNFIKETNSDEIVNKNQWQSHDISHNFHSKIESQLSKSFNQPNSKKLLLTSDERGQLLHITPPDINNFHSNPQDTKSTESFFIDPHASFNTHDKNIHRLGNDGSIGKSLNANAKTCLLCNEAPLGTEKQFFSNHVNNFSNFILAFPKHKISGEGFQANDLRSSFPAFTNEGGFNLASVGQGNSFNHNNYRNVKLNTPKPRKIERWLNANGETGWEISDIPLSTLPHVTSTNKNNQNFLFGETNNNDLPLHSLHSVSNSSSFPNQNSLKTANILNSNQQKYSFVSLPSAHSLIKTLPSDAQFEYPQTEKSYTSVTYYPHDVTTNPHSNNLIQSNENKVQSTTPRPSPRIH